MNAEIFAIHLENFLVPHFISQYDKSSLQGRGRGVLPRSPNLAGADRRPSGSDGSPVFYVPPMHAGPPGPGEFGRSSCTSYPFHG